MKLLRNQKLASVGVLGICLFISRCAVGEIVKVEVEGVVYDIYTSGPYGLDGSVDRGTAMSGYFVYDTEDVPLGTGHYPLFDISMTIGNYVFGHNSASLYPAKFIVGTDPGYWVGTYSVMFDGTVFKDGNPVSWESQEWYGYLIIMDTFSSYEEYFISRELPDAETFPPFWVFDERAEFQVVFGNEGGFTIGGHLTDIRAIPEPATVLMLGFGGMMLLRRKSFTRRR